MWRGRGRDVKLGAGKTKTKQFEEWVRLYATELYSYAVVRLHNKQDAEDLVQSTFLKAYKNFEKFESGSNAHAWLFAILLNNIRDHVRKTARSPELQDFGEDYVLENIVADLSSDPEARLVQKEDLEKLSQGLASLPDHFSSPLLLREVRSLSYQEIADLLAIPIGTVMSRLSRARKLLVEFMTNEGDISLRRDSKDGVQ